MKKLKFVPGSLIYQITAIHQYNELAFFESNIENFFQEKKAQSSKLKLILNDSRISANDLQDYQRQHLKPIILVLLAL